MGLQRAGRRQDLGKRGSCRGRPRWEWRLKMGGRGASTSGFPPFAAHCHLCGSTASEKEAPAVGLFGEEVVLKRMEV